MPSVTIKPGQLGAILKADAKKRSAALRRGVKSAAMRGKRLLMKKTPVGADAHMRQSWEVNRDGEGYVLENTAPYAGIVERGARPHPVSPEGIDAIAHWAMRKHGLDEKEAHDMAEAIAWKLRHHGQEPTYFVRDSLDELEQFLDEEVTRYIDKVADGD